MGEWHALTLALIEAGLGISLVPASIAVTASTRPDGAVISQRVAHGRRRRWRGFTVDQIMHHHDTIMVWL